MGLPHAATIKLNAYEPPEGITHTVEHAPKTDKTFVNLYHDHSDKFVKMRIVKWDGKETMDDITRAAYALLETMRQYTCHSEPHRPRKYGTIRAIDLQPSIN